MVKLIIVSIMISAWSILLYLESDIGLRMNLGWGNLQIGFFVHKIYADKLFTFIALVTWQTLTDWLIGFDDALSSILTFIIITWAGARQNHWWWKLTEEATRCKQRHNNVKQVILQVWLTLEWGGGRHVSLNSSHLYPSGHMHVYPFTASVHCAPFLHLLSWQSS